jgi:hypothetical protein
MLSFIYRIIIVLLLYIYSNVAVLPGAGAAAGGRAIRNVYARGRRILYCTPFFAAQSPGQYSSYTAYYDHSIGAYTQYLYIIIITIIMYLYARVIRSRSESATKRRSYKEIHVCVRVCVCDCYIDLLPRIIGAPRAYTQYI